MKPKTHMCSVGACDAYGYEGDVCNQQFMHKGEPHGPMIPIPNRARYSCGLCSPQHPCAACIEATKRANGV